MKEFFRKKNVRRIVYYGVYMLVLLILQTMVLARIRPLGVGTMFLPAACVAVGMFEGATWSAVFGLFLGIFADMAYVENSVMFTILFPAIAFASNFLARFFINKRFVGFMGLSALALLSGSAAQMVRVIATDGFTPVMVYVLLLQTLWSLVPAILAYYPPAKWIKRYE